MADPAGVPDDLVGLELAARRIGRQPRNGRGVAVDVLIGRRREPPQRLVVGARGLARLVEDPPNRGRLRPQVEGARTLDLAEGVAVFQEEARPVVLAGNGSETRRRRELFAARPRGSDERIWLGDALAGLTRHRLELGEQGVLDAVPAMACRDGDAHERGGSLVLVGAVTDAHELAAFITRGEQPDRRVLLVLIPREPRRGIAVEVVGSGIFMLHLVDERDVGVPFPGIRSIERLGHVQGSDGEGHVFLGDDARTHKLCPSGYEIT